MHKTDLKRLCGHGRSMLRVLLKIRLDSVHFISSVSTSFSKSVSSLFAEVGPLQLSLQKEVVYPLNSRKTASDIARIYGYMSQLRPCKNAKE